MHNMNLTGSSTSLVSDRYNETDMLQATSTSNFNDSDTTIMSSPYHQQQQATSQSVQYESMFSGQEQTIIDQVQYILSRVKSSYSSRLPQRTAENASQTLKRFEDVLDDERFHKLEFVRKIKHALSQRIDPLLEDLAPKPNEMGADMVPVLVSTIVSSSEYADISNRIMQQVQITVQAILGLIEGRKKSHQMLPSSSNLKINFANFPHTSSNVNLGSGKLDHNRDNSVSGHSNFTLESCSMGSISSGLCPGIDELDQIVIALQQSQPREVRFSAAQKLASFSVGDLISDEFWSNARVGIEQAVIDVDSRISMVALRIYAKAFRCAPLYLIPDIYVSLITQIRRCFEPGGTRGATALYSSIPRWSQGLHVEDDLTQSLLRKMRLLNHFMVDLPTMWFRFPDHSFKDVTNSTFQLLGMKAGKGTMTPLNLLCIVDTDAKWFQKWTLSQIGKTQVTSAMARCGILAELTQVFVEGALLYSSTSFNSTGTASTIHSGTTYGPGSPQSPRSPSTPYSPSIQQSNGKRHEDVIVEDMDQEEYFEKRPSQNHLISSQDIQYITFLHVTVILSKLCTSVKGRQCFPLELSPHFSKRHSSELTNRLPQNHETGSFELPLDTFLRILTQQISRSRHLNFATEASKSQPHEYKLSLFNSHLLRHIISFNPLCRKEYFKNDISRILTHPLRLVLQGSTFSESTDTPVFIAIAETLSDIASTESGRRFILHGEKDTGTFSERIGQSYNDSLDTIVQFVIKSMQTNDALQVPRNVLSAFIFFLRQLYRTSEGISYLGRHNFHQSFAHIKLSLENNEIVSHEWHKSLIDNLLNFAATPKGVWFLYESGLMEPCVNYMVKRYTQKAKVSKCEKFGYGTLVSQIAVTQAGMRALVSSGFLDTLFTNLWSILEGQKSQHASQSFGTTSLETILQSHTTTKAVQSIVKAISSFHGLTALLATEMDTENSLDRKMGLTYLLDCICFGKRRTRNNVEIIPFDDAHQIGLCLLSALVSSLDSFLILEEMFSIQENLSRLQRNSIIGRGQDAMLLRDHNSLVRNQILLSTMIIGGPGERMIPSTDLKKDIPIFLGDRIPVGIILNSNLLEPIVHKDALELLETGDLDDAAEWIAKVRMYFDRASKRLFSVKGFSRKLLSRLWNVYSDPLQKNALEKLKQDAGIISHTGTMSSLTTQAQENDGLDLRKSDINAISLGAEYAQRNINNSSVSIKEHFDNLQRIVQIVSRQDQTRLHVSTRDHIKAGHDWFPFSIYIMCEGDLSMTLSILEHVRTTSIGPYLWSRMSFSHSNQVPLICRTSCHGIDLILSSELPHVYSAFILSGCTPTQICERWIRECFWNVLDFDQISTYISLCHLFGLDYQLYFCIALLKHAKSQILKSTQSQNLIMLFQQPIPMISNRFCGLEHLPFMHELRSKYRNLVLNDMISAL